MTYPASLAAARWMWADQYFSDTHNLFAQFRHTFALKQVPRQAPLQITADQCYILYVNGRLVCRGPARGFQESWPYDEVDIASYLQRGRNVIAVRAYSFGQSTFGYINRGVAGVIVGAQWGDVRIASPNEWRARRQVGVSRDTVPVSLQLNPQEHVDARLEAADWAAVDFDDSDWEHANSMAAPGAMPWHDVEPRGIPLMREEVVLPRAVIGTAKGTSPANWRGPLRDVALLIHGEQLAHQPVPAKDAAFGTLKMPATGVDGYQRVLIDFGRCVVGAPELAITGCVGGEVIDLLYTETIAADTLTPDFKIPSGCKMVFASRLTCRAGRTHHAFFHPYGFRYLVLIVRGSVAPVKIDLHLNWVGYPLDRQGALRTSDSALAGIWETCAWTQQCCMMDAYVDTPWREQAQWWGDARVQGWNTFHISGDARLFRRGIAQIAGQRTPEGLTYGHAPTIAHNCILPDFSLIWLMTLWDHYWQTGSTEAFTTHRARIDDLLGYFIGKLDKKSGLLPYDQRYWLFLDWAPIHKDGYSTVYNAWFVLALEAIARLADITGERTAARGWRALAAPVRKALGKLVDKQGLLRDGLDWKRKPVAATSVQAQVLAFMLELDGHDAEGAFQRILLPYLRGEELSLIHI
jgi:alpha-L-rhamnosidase